MQYARVNPRLRTHRALRSRAGCGQLATGSSSVRSDEPQRIARPLRIEDALRECIARDVERDCARICTLTAFRRALRAPALLRIEALERPIC